MHWVKVDGVKGMPEPNWPVLSRPQAGTTDGANQVRALWPHEALRKLKATDPKPNVGAILTSEVSLG